jgi:hypothetical protein
MPVTSIKGRLNRAGAAHSLILLIALLTVLAMVLSGMREERRASANLVKALTEFGRLARALAAYHVDQGAYPPCNTFALSGLKPGQSQRAPRDFVLERLSTPVAYIDEPFRPDPYSPTGFITLDSVSELPYGSTFDILDDPIYQVMKYVSWDSMGRTLVPGDPANFTDGYRSAHSWLLESCGPDRLYFAMGGILANFSSAEACLIIYDPTNGLDSYGAIFRVGGEMTEGYGYGVMQAVREFQPTVVTNEQGLVHY